MGLIYADITISNPLMTDLHPIQTKALADTGALHMCLPPHIALQLKLKTLEEREVTLANGTKQIVPYAGPIELQFNNRRCYVGAMILGDEALLGAIPMEDMDLILSPAMQAITVNPNNPNIPSSVAKGIRRF